jgi:hypothetical protein
MTQDNIGMPSLETWVRQLNGELNVSQVANVRAKLPEVVKPYCVFLRGLGTVGLVSSTNHRRSRPCNVEFTFDGDTNKLIGVKLINNDSNEE